MHFTGCQYRYTHLFIQTWNCTIKSTSLNCDTAKMTQDSATVWWYMIGLLLFPWFSSPEIITDNVAVNFVIVAIICVLHQMSAQYKTINYTKLDKSIACNKSCDDGKVSLGQVRIRPNRLRRIWSDEIAFQLSVRHLGQHWNEVVQAWRAGAVNTMLVVFMVV